MAISLVRSCGVCVCLCVCPPHDLPFRPHRLAHTVVCKQLQDSQLVKYFVVPGGIRSYCLYPMLPPLLLLIGRPQQDEARPVKHPPLRCCCHEHLPCPQDVLTPVASSWEDVSLTCLELTYHD
ncbi:hypothetical protein K456DRAFT_50595 [Colletotrichum gloeosporioides 23]|nr:hypothetical protein K456DRAFT_50595 [Colletotrichum gloeosporioides 23]